MPSEGIGRWEISIGEHGSRMKRGLAFTEYSWEDYNCLAETEDTFYFVNSGAGRGILDKTAPLPKNDRMFYILIALVLLAVLISSIIRDACL